jgi:hypothetical protein
MKKPENIYVSLQLSKDISSGELVLNIHFDQNAPNFYTDKNTISWCPTIEELDFVSEAFGMLSKRKRQRYNRTDVPEEDTPSRELIREADEKEILDRVFEKKKPSYSSD